MSGTIPPLPNTPSWRGAPLKHRNNFTFYNIRVDIRELVWEGVEWKHLAEDRDQWRAVVNMVGNFLTS
jgi:hypothetical protein